jgi:hypothetical protein
MNGKLGKQSNRLRRAPRAKTAYFDALRSTMPELENIATGKEPRSALPLTVNEMSV